jgi:surfactin synthase thioesterase subunit
MLTGFSRSLIGQPGRRERFHEPFPHSVEKLPGVADRGV